MIMQPFDFRKLGTHFHDNAIQKLFKNDYQLKSLSMCFPLTSKTNEIGNQLKLSLPSTEPTNRNRTITTSVSTTSATVTATATTTTTTTATIPTLTTTATTNITASSSTILSTATTSINSSSDDEFERKSSVSQQVLNLSFNNRDDASTLKTLSLTNTKRNMTTTKRHWSSKMQLNLGTQFINPTTGKKRVQCNVCLKTFCDKGALKIHFSAVHLREMHKCTVDGCNMMFSSRRSRNRHSANPNPKLHSPHLRRKISPHDGRSAQTNPILLTAAAAAAAAAAHSTSFPFHTFPLISTSSAIPINFQLKKSNTTKQQQIESAVSNLTTTTSTNHNISGNNEPEPDPEAEDFSLPSKKLIITPTTVPTLPPFSISTTTTGATPENEIVHLKNNTEKRSKRKNQNPTKRMKNCYRENELSMSSFSSVSSLSPSSVSSVSSSSSLSSSLSKEVMSLLSRDHFFHHHNNNNNTGDEANDNDNNNDEENADELEKRDDGTNSTISYFSHKSDEMPVTIRGGPNLVKTENVHENKLLPIPLSPTNQKRFIDEQILSNGSATASNQSSRSPSLVDDDDMFSNYIYSECDSTEKIPTDKDNPKRCTTCGKVFQNQLGVKAHYQNVHLKLMHKCNIEGCSATFPSKRSRDRHSANTNLHKKLLSTTTPFTITTITTPIVTASISTSVKNDFSKIITTNESSSSSSPPSILISSPPIVPSVPVPVSVSKSTPLHLPLPLPLPLPSAASISSKEFLLKLYENLDEHALNLTTNSPQNLYSGPHYYHHRPPLLSFLTSRSSSSIPPSNLPLIFPPVPKCPFIFQQFESYYNTDSSNKNASSSQCELEKCDKKPIANHDDNEIVCHFCKLNFKNALYFKKHFELMHFNEMLPCTASGCSKLFLSQSERNAHLKHRHFH